MLREQITTLAQLMALPVGTVIRSDVETIASRYSDELGVLFGDERPFPWRILALPATLLFRPDAPVTPDAQASEAAAAGWTIADWEQWAHDVAATMPESWDGDEAEVDLIARFVEHAAGLVPAGASTQAWVHASVEEFHGAFHDDALLVRDAERRLWLAWESDDGDWYAIRARDEDDVFAEGWRPVGPVGIESLAYPVTVARANATLTITASSEAETIRRVAYRLGGDASSSDYMADQVSDGALSWISARIQAYAEELDGVHVHTWTDGPDGYASFECIECGTQTTRAELIAQRAAGGAPAGEVVPESDAEAVAP